MLIVDSEFIFVSLITFFIRFYLITYHLRTVKLFFWEIITEFNNNSNFIISYGKITFIIIYNLFTFIFK